MSPRLGVFYDERVLDHDTGEGMWEAAASELLAEQEPHPEGPARIRNMHSVLQRGPIAPYLRWHEGRLATEDELATVHERDYINSIREHCEQGARLTGTTVVSANSWTPLLAAAGTCLAAADAVLEGREKAAFALVRPPGHHAQPAQADGYCAFSHASLAAQRARDHGMKRVAIIDWDVHHGNGTQECFYRRNDVLTVSIHMAHGSWGPSHPQSGETSELGEGEGTGYAINIAYPPGAGDDAYARAFTELIGPALRRYRPDLLVCSVGQDASTFDPNGRHNVTMAGFHRIGELVRELADELTNGRVVGVQEGGYARSYAAYCLHATLEGLLGLPQQLPDPLAYVPDRPGFTPPEPETFFTHWKP